MVSDLKIFVWKWSNITVQKKEKFFLLFLPYKTCWKPCFPMDERPLVKGYIANFGISLDIFEFLRFGWFFAFKKKEGFWVFLVHPTVVLMLLSASVERCIVSHMRDFCMVYLFSQVFFFKSTKPFISKKRHWKKMYKSLYLTKKIF